ncbi:response regulator [Leptothrix discophora]|uniref:Response regulator transcription factor n=1 Tax=Leptothrix discophora TaxID=89 RepID=A0ABT9G3Y9_LEPDI|nr:response regulator transcription factor [Leptothrix discophora]MDP4301189.1 response regulator transcription factor [Leptothrix discophora]
MIRVMLVDDHTIVRMGFKMLLESSGADIEVVAEAGSGDEALAELERNRPDLLVLDLSMPGMSGLELLRRLRARDDTLRVLVLSAHEDTAHPRRVLAAGAQGYLSKRGAPEALVDAIRRVAAGQRYIDPAIAQKLALAQLGNEPNPVDALSEREFEVFVMLARGASVADIASRLKLSASTVGTHLYNVKQKLGAANQAELTLLALRWGLLEA